MKYIRRANERGVANFGWLNSKHSFSFGNYYDPKHMGISALRVINDDMVMPGQGFGTHGHRDMEIISYVIEGALKHEDSEGNAHVIPAGDVQRMSAGSGIMHSEFNASQTDPVNFFQIWIQPNRLGTQPSYAQKTLPQEDPLTPLVTPDGEGNTLSMQQNARMSRLMLSTGDVFHLASHESIGYLHLIKGELTTEDDTFGPGDAFAIDPNQVLQVKAGADVEALWFELPAAR
ncbi:pirin family protein [Aliidiomarina taiwanensis]|uniref:Pirin family protein n=1 Tax=Aliidiomarina taiwanensis TaxID=946228 RepID=A0A432X9Y5_9GAMM|nr:pirin family protein [Aliidiomarina taiwanensis]RUO44134.1 pirin family protein [Aliidiomarina taiwanensis]